LTVQTRWVIEQLADDGREEVYASGDVEELFARGG
jgi:hypothetical protein